MMGIVQTGTTEGSGRAGVMIPVPGFSMYQARLLQHNSYQVTVVTIGRFIIEWPITIYADNPMNESELVANACSRRQAWF